MATAADRPALFALRHEVFVVGQDVPVELELDEHDPACDHTVALDETGAVVGTGRLLDDGTIGRMAVAPGRRGQGIGAAVLTRLEQRARERDMPAVQLHAQVHARGFYERAGYAVEGEPYVEAGIDHITMRKVLRDTGRAAPIRTKP